MGYLLSALLRSKRVLMAHTLLSAACCCLVRVLVQPVGPVVPVVSALGAGTGAGPAAEAEAGAGAGEGAGAGAGFPAPAPGLGLISANTHIRPEEGAPAPAS